MSLTKTSWRTILWEKFPYREWGRLLPRLRPLFPPRCCPQHPLALWPRRQLLYVVAASRLVVGVLHGWGAHLRFSVTLGGR